MGAIPSVPSRFSVLLSSCLLHASRGQNVASSSKHDPICAMSVASVKVLCVLFLGLVQTRSHLCHVGSVCSSHLVCSTHLEDKRGALEQERNEPVLSMSVQSKCCVCFSQPSSKHEFIYALSVQCAPPILFASRISWTNVDPSSKHEPVFNMSVESKYCVCFS